jgi:hypothetical protein
MRHSRLFIPSKSASPRSSRYQRVCSAAPLYEIGSLTKPMAAEDLATLNRDQKRCSSGVG